MRQLTSALATGFLATVWAVPSLAQNFPEHEFYRHHGWGYGHMIFGGLMMIAFWAGVIVLIVLAVRWLGGHGPTRHDRPTGRPSALEILEERYARGEIDHEEFTRRKQLLSE